MKIKGILIAISVLFGTNLIYAQIEPPLPKPLPTAKPIVKSADKNQNQTVEVSRDVREQAYAKLLEGQRYIWDMTRNESNQGAKSTNAEAQMAKLALQKAIELNPGLAEAYTALADLTRNTPPGDVDESIKLANSAVKIDPNNFGAHQILGQLYTFKSKISRNGADNEFTKKAIEEWKQIARLDPRNAEAYAFLSELYLQTEQPTERINALRRWLSAATPVDSRYYRALMGRNESLTPDSALVKLGAALLETEEKQEAVEILSRAVADSPDNLSAIELLRVAIETADDSIVADSIQALQQAVFSNPDSPALISLLAQVHVRSGNLPEALKVIRTAREKNPADYGLLRTEAIILTDNGKVDEAVARVKESMDRKDSASESGIATGSGASQITLAANNDFTNYLFISSLYTQAKRHREAVEAANSASTSASNAREKQLAELTLATAQQMSGDFPAAEQTLRNLLKEMPGNPIALNNLGYFLVERSENLDEALMLIQKALKIDPTNSSYLDSLGWAYFKLNKLTEAEKYLKIALDFDSSSATLFEHLGDVYQKQGKTELAADSWKKAVKLSSDAEEIKRLKEKLKTK